MATTFFVAGPYRVTYAHDYLGITQRGVELEYTFHGETVQGDIIGDSTIDSVYLGGDVFANMVLQEARLSGVRRLAWPFAISAGIVQEGVIGRVGRLATDLAEPLLLTARAGTSAASEGPLSISIPLSLLAANTAVRILYSSRHRNVPVRLQAFPYKSQSAEDFLHWFETT